MHKSANIHQLHTQFTSKCQAEAELMAESAPYLHGEMNREMATFNVNVSNTFVTARDTWSDYDKNA